MIGYLLDTNVVSELRRPSPDPTVVHWIADVPAEQLHLPAVTIGEIQPSIELTREQDATETTALEARLDQATNSCGVSPTHESDLT